MSEIKKDLSGATLIEANLRRAKLIGANLDDPSDGTDLILKETTYVKTADILQALETWGVALRWNEKLQAVELDGLLFDPEGHGVKLMNKLRDAGVSNDLHAKGAITQRALDNRHHPIQEDIKS